jgi:hypothetical protein
MGLDSYLQVNGSNPELSQNATPSNPRPQPPSQQQYTFQPASNQSQGGSQIRFIDSNPRPAKSPRHVAPPELPASSSYSDFGARFAPPYHGPGELLPPRDLGYFPTSLSMQQSWTATSDTSGVYGAPLHASAPGQHYQFPNDGYVKQEPNQRNNYTWNPS